MQARSALFDLYGDYLRSRGGSAPVAALVRLLAPLGIGAPAVRTAVSRMVRQGWLRPTRSTGGPGYELTPKAVRRVDEAAARIYRTTPAPWKGSFDLLLVEPPPGRSARFRLAANLRYLGYGGLDGTSWIAPRAAVEVDALLQESEVTARRFTAEPAGGLSEAVTLVRRAWDLEAIATAYQKFVEELRPIVEPVGSGSGDTAGYVARFRLVHAWRAFLFRDPQLPAELLPDPWPGHTAARFFDRHARRLRRAADRYVQATLIGENSTLS
ncbi:MAG TPA: PaaX family transcriptional regulator C-terminal domain-containing protein [Micromonosporaceae bacterium]|nr:PaaX family transcriptional regulator C-terminal domain-containing protein [Micromonosporaceae bacterium]